MDKKVILFDIDGTLINTKALAKIFCEKIATESNINPEKIIQLRDEYVNTLEYSTDYHPNGLINFINQKTNKKLDSKNIFFKNDNIYKKYIFDDTYEFLNKFKDKYIFGIFSEGFKDYQLIKTSSLINFLEKDLIFITRRKLDDAFLKTIPEKVMIIDDKKEVIETLKKMRPDLNLIWINRKDSEKMEGVKTITSLGELENLI